MSMITRWVVAIGWTLALLFWVASLMAMIFALPLVALLDILGLKLFGRPTGLVRYHA